MIAFWLLMLMFFVGLAIGVPWGHRRERARVEYEAQMKLWRESGHR